MSCASLRAVLFEEPHHGAKLAVLRLKLGDAGVAHSLIDLADHGDEFVADH
jgi:hypothetical protein